MKKLGKTPCSNCPFRPSVNFPLGSARRKEIAKSLLDDRNIFPCHKTIDYDDTADTSNQSHCVGAAATLTKMGRPGILLRVDFMSGYPWKNLLEIEDSYDTLQEFIDDDPEG